MEELKSKMVITLSNASGAAYAARMGFSVLIIDVIDMATSLEAALQEGAAFIFGASPDITKAPAQVNPFGIGIQAGKLAANLNTNVILIAEPRLGSKKEREANCSQVIKGINEYANIEAILPNVGAGVVELVDFKKKIVVCVSESGGVAFDAAWQYHERVTVGTIARTKKTKGKDSVLCGIERIMKITKENGIAIIAASSNSLEDVLAANYFMQVINQREFTKL